MNLKNKRKIKLQVLDFPEWKKNSTCYIFSVRSHGVDPDIDKPTWSLDSWIKVDYSDLDVSNQAISMIKLRARANMGYVYVVWLPDELALDIDSKNNPEDHMELIMKYKFKI